MSGFDDEIALALGGGGFDDELSAALSADAPSEPEPPTAADDSEAGILSRLFAEPEVLRRSRAQQEAAGVSPRSGWANAADAASAVMFPAAAFGGGMRGALAGIGAEAAQGAILGGVEGFTESDKADLLGKVSDAARESGLGAAVGGAFGTAGRVASEALAPLGRGLEALARKGKNVVAGGNARDAAEIASRHGSEAVDNFGALLDKYSPSPALGMSSGGHLDRIKALRAKDGHELRQLQGLIGDRHITPDVAGGGSLLPGTHGDLGQAKEKLLRELVDEAARARGGLGADEGQYAGALDAIRKQLSGTPDRFSSTPRSFDRGAPVFMDDAEQAAFADRRRLGIEGPSSQPDVEPLMEDAAAAEAFAQRQRLGVEPPTSGHYYETTIDPGLSGRDFESFPGLVGAKSRLQGFAHSAAAQGVPDNASKQAAAFAGDVLKGEVSRIASQAPPEIARSYANKNERFADLSVLEDLLAKKTGAEQSGGNFANAVTGAALGGLLGGAGATVGDSDQGLGASIGAGIGGVLATGTNAAVRQAAGTWGADFGANMLRRAGQGAAGGARAATAGVNVSSALGSAADVNGMSRGHTLTSQVENALTRPGALGQYSQQLQQAKARGELTEEVNRLYDDPEFRALLRGLR